MKYIPEREALNLYDEMLDDCNPIVNVCGFKYSPSYALKQLDETAYRCGFNDWCDAENITTDEDEILNETEEE